MPDTIADALEELVAEVAAETGDQSGVIENTIVAYSAVSNQLLKTADKWQPFGPVTVLGIMPTGGVNRSAEIDLALGVVSEVTSLISINYLAGVTSAMRLVTNGHTYYIGALVDVGNRHKLWQLYCGETLRP